jgi:hypothetical protein
MDNESKDVMHRRRITLKDGRYMIFYTFDGEPEVAAPDDAEEAIVEPQPKNEAGDEP